MVELEERGKEGSSISFCAKDEAPYLKDIEKLIRLKIKEVKDNPFPWNESKPSNEPVKKDLRNKKKEQTNSRKSDASKKNKKRWY